MASLNMDISVAALHCISRHAESALQVVISRLGHPQLSITKEAFREMELFLRDGNISHFAHHHADSLLSMIVTHMRHLHSILPCAPPLERQNLAHAYMTAVRVLKEIFKPSNAAMMREISSGTVSELLLVLISTLTDPNLMSLFNGELLRRYINILTLQILQTANASAVINGTIRLVKTTLQTCSNPQIKDVVLRCESQLVKMFPQWSAQGISLSDTDLAELLRELQAFNRHHSSVTAQPLSITAPELQDKSDEIAVKLLRSILAAVINYVGIGRIEKVIKSTGELEGTVTLAMGKRLACKIQYK